MVNHCISIRVAVMTVYAAGEYYRILLAPWAHVSVVHLFFNLTTLLSVRIVEKFYGTLFFVKYTILLTACEIGAIIGLTYAIVKVFRVRLVSAHPLMSLSVMGLTGQLLGWLAFCSVDYTLNRASAPASASSSASTLAFYVFGIIPVPMAFGPIFMMLLAPCFTPRSNTLTQAGGLFAGYLLALGVFKIMPNTYWTIAILGDFALWVAWMSLKSSNISDVEQAVLSTRREPAVSPLGSDVGTELVYVTLIGDPEIIAAAAAHNSSLARSSSSADISGGRGGGGDAEEGTIEDLQAGQGLEMTTRSSSSNGLGTGALTSSVPISEQHSLLHSPDDDEDDSGEYKFSDVSIASGGTSTVGRIRQSLLDIRHRSANITGSSSGVGGASTYQPLPTGDSNV
jgi:membrane associated rhomboid family serine protease